MPDQYQSVDQSIQSALLKLDAEGHNNKRSEILISLQNINNSIDCLFSTQLTHSTGRKRQWPTEYPIGA
ncbi:MAG: hypothetical protein Ct9H300mP4_11230 [Gammaproteobacteria bacterium]|nr:MAG: hypothetical protein Ct9H300mP4_11230 [Gammaproteobacteria bacterium]